MDVRKSSTKAVPQVRRGESREAVLAALRVNGTEQPRTTSDECS